MQGADGGETCWSLIARAARGDDGARSRFARGYLPLVRAFLVARWRGTELASEVDDAVQEVFVECFRPSGPLERASSAAGEFRGFLFGVVRHVAQRVEDRRRGGARGGVGEAALEELPDPASGVSRAFDREWARALMREAGELMRERASDESARRRVELLRLRFADDMPIRDIAARFAMEAEAVHRAYARAREEFRLCLREVVSFHCVRREQDLDAECRRLFALLA